MQTPEASSPKWDAFISHASEDKQSLVDPLALALKGQGLHVWYDAFTLNVGDSLRQKIDEGLAKSRFGIVVLSEHIFRKRWPQQELDGLVALEHGGRKVILPVWHGIGHDQVCSHSPLLAGRIGILTDGGVPHVVAKLLPVLTGSTPLDRPRAKVMRLTDDEVVVNLASRSMLWPVPRGYIIVEGVPLRTSVTAAEIHYLSLFDRPGLSTVGYDRAFDWRAPDQFWAAIGKLNVPYGDYGYAEKALRFAVDICHARVRYYDEDKLRYSDAGRLVDLSFTGGQFVSQGEIAFHLPKGPNRTRLERANIIRDLGAEARGLVDYMPEYFSTPDWNEAAEELRANILGEVAKVPEAGLSRLAKSANTADLREWLAEAAEALDKAAKWHPRVIRK